MHRKSVFIAMTILANAPNIDLVGVTVLSGNKWAQESVAMGVRQLEMEIDANRFWKLLLDKTYWKSVQ